MYEEDEYLPLSGVQHYAYCPRQWALIHIERVWADNVRTVEGQRVHERCHDALIKERRGSLIMVRGLRVSSSCLGLTGICDVVEFSQSDRGTFLAGEEGRWLPTPVEYKCGSSKVGLEDRVQVCAQAICLEEVFGCQVDVGYLYYGVARHREAVLFDEPLRAETQRLANAMHSLFLRGTTPSARRKRGCAACSLKELCLPELSCARSVSEYIASMIGSDWSDGV